MASTTSITSAATQAQQTQQQGNKLNQDFDDFLNLLTTQLQNQDPMEPMKSKEFTDQLVKFSGVEQQINTNAKLDELIKFNLNAMSGSALNYVGMDASYMSNELSWDGQNPVNVTYAFDGAVANNKINIVDQEGNLVYSQDGATKAGQNSFTWDGTMKNGQPAPEGTYQVRIDATKEGGAPAESSVVVSGRVRGVETQDGIVHLLVGDRAIELGQVINASMPQNAGNGSTGNENSANQDDRGEETGSAA